MIIFPAIDIRQGKCVRLTQGRFDQQTVYGDQPAAMAKRWAEQGAAFLHVVDLDGAVAGHPVNTASIAAIVRSVDIPVQLGGGLRTLADIEAMLALGVSRVILGSVAVRQPSLIDAACAAFGERIVIGIDARDGQVAVEGWGVSGGMEASELAKKMAAAGVQRIVYTDIARDGMLQGVNAAATASLARLAGIAVIASGGVSGLDDIRSIRAVQEQGVEGVIVGKALYTGSLDLQQALQVARGA